MTSGDQLRCEFHMFHFDIKRPLTRAEMKSIEKIFKGTKLSGEERAAQIIWMFVTNDNLKFYGTH